jgi:hypothetical protein
MILHCPCCHARFSIEALTQDTAARELLGMRGAMPPSLLSYLTLFRSEKRALSFDHALKLAKEALALSGNPAQLEAAMAQTVESMRAKREQGEAKPLKNHNYLKRVLESTPAALPAPTSSDEGMSVPASARSKTASAIGALETYKRG